MKCQTNGNVSDHPISRWALRLQTNTFQGLRKLRLQVGEDHQY